MSTSKDKCPLCKSDVDEDYGGYKCMNCAQKFHGSCAFNKSMREKPNDRYLRDDLVICPSCLKHRVEMLSDPGINANYEILDALKLNPNKRGGKKRKTRKARKARKTKKNRKTNKKKY
jgi:hypothetical protein